jgi:hypothetical protein
VEEIEVAIAKLRRRAETVTDHDDDCQGWCCDTYYRTRGGVP